MFINILTIVSGLITIIGFIFSIFATDWENSTKMYVLIGIIPMTTVPIIAYFYRLRSKKVSGEFEWQWAGENMIGTMVISNEKSDNSLAEIIINRVKSKHDNGNAILEKRCIMESSSAGNIHGNKDGFKLELPVRKYIYNDDNNVHTTEAVTLKGKLYPVEAYAGKVQYHYAKGTKETGDMVVIKYISGIRFY
ncbi:MAG: hypothetical protein HYS23_00005 [Geobacter sp.]|nr:hypothetical protein [Geobacter sp.]